VLASPASWLKSENLALAALGGMALAAGAASRNRRDYLREVEQRAQRAERTREQAERTREQEARRRVTEERLRIAHDLHDSVGHQLALINVQAGVAEFLLDTDPGQARVALTHVTTATRSALEELHATVGLLREPGDSPAPTGPVVGLTGLAELFAAYRRSGLTVDQRVRGAVRRLPPAADLTAYRVIQESLTNVCKHAACRVARVQLSYHPDVLTIVVDDDGPPPATGPPPEAGHGIAGMRERVAALGGEFQAGPRPAGGFRVTATLPLRSQPA
jgi:signal transduction histidine kinase